MDLFSFKNHQKKGKKVGVRRGGEENRKYAIKKCEELGPRVRSIDYKPEGKTKGIRGVGLKSKCGGSPERG